MITGILRGISQFLVIYLEKPRKELFSDFFWILFLFSLMTQMKAVKGVSI
jgi:hypothetical protein